MAKNNCYNPTILRTAIAIGMVVIFSGASNAWAEQGSRTATPQTFKFGKATLTWHKAPGAVAKQNQLIAGFKRATNAHVTGDEPVVTPDASPVPVARRSSVVTSNPNALSMGTNGQMLPLRPELMFTMFADEEGHSYCSDSTVVSTDQGEQQ